MGFFGASTCLGTPTPILRVLLCTLGLQPPENDTPPLGVVPGDTSPFFPGILLSRKPSEPQGKQLAFEKNDG